MQIVALDSKPLLFDDIDFSDLKKLGVLSLYPRTEPDLIRQRLRGADIVLTNRAALDREAIFGASNLKLICLMGNDFSIVDIQAAAEKGVSVCFVPDYASREIAQHIVGLLLEMTLHTGYHDRLIHKGAWCSSQDYCWFEKTPLSLIGKTVGLIGCGSVGKETAKLLSAFQMRVIGYDPQKKNDFPGEQVDVQEVLETADVISLCCPLTDENSGFFNAQTLEKMKPGALLINVSSGKLVCEADICRGLERGSLGGYAADTVISEPLSVHNPLLRAPNCVISGHCSTSSLSARRRLIEKTVENIEAFLSGHPIHLVF